MLISPILSSCLGIWLEEYIFFFFFLTSVWGPQVWWYAYINIDIDTDWIDRDNDRHMNIHINCWSWQENSEQEFSLNSGRVNIDKLGCLDWKLEKD